ncbi:MAG: 50S ribosomal protein L29 [Desulfobacterales bacterium]|nr:50S ribosomal protein L29 [Desulfobacterales bacterium]MBF0396452.1 50S ribosomal protein L29 [Desulfobacterales bacterium]
MKLKEIRELTKDEMDRKLVDYKQELFNLRFQHATSQLENPKKLGQTKKTIARIKTILRELELSNQGSGK